MTISELKVAKRKLENEISIATDKVVKAAEIMEDSEFWALTEILKNKIKEDGDVKTGIHNFFCFGTSFGCYGRDEEMNCASYVKTYKAKCSAVISKDELWEMMSKIGYYSDDGWSDFCDYLPLEGEDRYNKVLNGKVNKLDKYETREEYIKSALEEKVFAWLG